MDEIWASGGPQDQTHVSRDLVTQSIISVGFGLIAFLAFCFLRPRWTDLYAARKIQKNAASRLPELPDTLLGWMPVLYRISEDEVLASAGLDAFVFLAFFRMAIKYLAFLLLFSIIVIYPVHKTHRPEEFTTLPNNDTALFSPSPQRQGSFQVLRRRSWEIEASNDYLWIYVIFVYLFSTVGIYLIISETKRIIFIRQKYLGTQSSVTDRTIRLSGIPAHLRSEEKIKEIIENLEIGKVDSVMLCKNWKELDDLMADRMRILRKLEEAWTVHLGYQRLRRLWSSVHEGARQAETDDDANEETILLESSGEQPHISPYTKDRPSTRIWFGFLNLQSRKIDAINYYEEKLRRLDEKLDEARKKEYNPTPLAFVTLDSIAACQMVVQAVLDPVPMQLMANAAPAPSDVVWKNTYLPRSTRMVRSWTVTAFVVVLTVVWSFTLIPIAGLINDKAIGKVAPGFEDFLKDHKVLQSLVTTGLPTLTVSLLNVLVPYLYDWLSNLQGMISQGDVEMSLISKNFFFTFFNLFVVFTIFGTAANILQVYDEIGKQLKDVTVLLATIAKSLQNVAPFYMNLIVLQAFGLFPFRLLEFGTVFLYPITLMGSKTPRDYAELVQPPVFNYGFYLPQTLLIFIICIVYSVLPKSELVVLFGLIYFLMGSFIYKYQLLYAMDHRQHSTGRAWPLICNRFVVGLIVFQVAMAAQLFLLQAIKRSLVVIPLLVGTVWFSYFYQRTYRPLMENIALLSLHGENSEQRDRLARARHESESQSGRVVDESEETGLRYVNPSLIIPLEEVWLSKKRAKRTRHISNGNGGEIV